MTVEPILPVEVISFPLESRRAFDFAMLAVGTGTERIVHLFIAGCTVVLASASCAGGNPTGGAGPATNGTGDGVSDAGQPDTSVWIEASASDVGQVGQTDGSVQGDEPSMQPEASVGIEASASDAGLTDGSIALPPVQGDELFVSTAGDDANPGTRDKPLKTLAGAQAAVQRHPDKGKKPITVTVLPGTYYVGRPVVFTAADSGTQSAPITYRGGTVAVASGGAKLNLTWTAYKNGILQASVPASVSGTLAFDVLFLNGQRQRLARYPNYRAGVVPLGGGAADAVSTTRVAGWAHSPVGGYVHGLQANAWGSEHYVIKSVDANHTLVLDGPFGNGRSAGLQNGTQVVENILDELDVPSEWYFDRTAGVLYLMPPSGVDLSTATVEVSGVERVFEFSGTSAAPVQWITLDGFHYMHTSRTFFKATEIVLRSDWEIYRNGAIFVTGAEDCTVQNSFFDQVGGAGVFVNGYNRRVAVTHNKFVGTGSSALLFMGSAKAVRNPLVGYGAASVPVAQLDMMPGPLTNDYPASCTASDNLIHDVGDPEKQATGIGIDMAQDITVTHNSIYSMPRAGINVGDGCWGGHVISYNDVFDTTLETGDHGAFNSWGRDRFWTPGTPQLESRVAQSPGIPYLDAVKPTTLTNNRWRCDHGWDVDLDDGSSNYVITSNVFLSGGLKWREGYKRLGDNNVFAKGTMSVHVWPKNNADIFTHNIFAGYSPVSPDGWGQQLDHNFFTNASALTTAHGNGTDANSAAGVPGYVDAANGNYLLSPTSAALAVGIKSLPNDSYGVVSLVLRAQARTPFLGAGGSMQPGTRDPTPAAWRGAQVANLIGPDEQFATGIGGDIGVFVQSVPAAGQAASDGLKPIDVILQLDGNPVTSLADLNLLYGKLAAGQTITLGVRRNQTDTTLPITR
jgi:hypothetical protein